MKQSFGIVFVYLSIYFFVPILGFFVFGESLWEGLSQAEEGTHLLLVLAVMISLAYSFLLISISSIFPDIRFKWIAILYSPSLVSVMALIFVVVGLKFYSVAGVRFRHQNEGLASLGYLGPLHIIGKLYLSFVVIMLVKFSRHWKNAALSSLVMIGFYLNYTTAFDAMAIILCFYGCLYHLRKERPGVKRPLFSKIRSLAFVLFSCAAVLFGGVFTKLNGDFSTFFDAAGGIAFYFIERLSVQLYSLMLILDSFSEWVFLDVYKALFYEVDLFFYRVSTLLGFSAERPYLEGLSRLNAESVYVNPRDITGASPGPVAVFILAPPMIIGSFITLILSSFFLKRMSLLTEGIPFGVTTIFSMQLFLNIWSGYFSILSILSPALISIVFLLASSEQVKKLCK